MKRVAKKLILTSLLLFSIFTKCKSQNFDTLFLRYYAPIDDTIVLPIYIVSNDTIISNNQLFKLNIFVHFKKLENKFYILNYSNKTDIDTTYSICPLKMFGNLLLLDGTTLTYSNNRLISKTNYTKGIYSGEEICYNKVGKIIQYRKYKNGLLNCWQREWDDNGQLRKKIRYKKGIATKTRIY